MVLAHLSAASSGRFCVLFKGICCALLLTTILFGGLLYAQDSGDPKTIFTEAEENFLNNNINDAYHQFLRFNEEYCPDDALIEECILAKLNLSSLQRRKSEFDDAKKHLRQAELSAVNNLPPESPLFVRLYSQYAYLYDGLDDLDEAKKWVDKSLEITSENGHQGVTAAIAYLSSGLIEVSLGNFQKSIDEFKIALDYLESNGERNTKRIRRLYSQGYTNMGIAYRGLGKFEQALQQYLNARQVVVDTFGEQDPEMAIIYNNLGSVSYFDGDYGSAAEYFLRAASIITSIDGETSGNTAIAYNNAGSSFLSLGDIEAAATYLEKAQSIKESIYGRNHIDIAVGYNNLASLYVQRKQNRTAEEYFKLSIEIRENVYSKTHPSLSPPLLQLSNLYIQENRFDEARTLLMHVLEIGDLRLHESHPDVIEATLLISDSDFEQGNLEKAEEGYYSVIRMLTDNRLQETASLDVDDISEVTNPVKFIESIRGLNSTLYKKYQNSNDERLLNRILHFTDIAANAIDFLQTTYQNEASKLNLLEKNYGIFSTALDVVYELYSDTGDNRYVDQMVYYSEKSRSRIAMEYLQSMDAIKFGEVPDDILAMEKQLNERVTSFFQQVNLEREKGDSSDEQLIRTLSDSLFYARRNLREFTGSLERDFPSYFRLKYDNRLAGTEDIRSMISSGETAVIYSFGEQGIFATLIDKNQKKIIKLPGNGDIKADVSLLREALTTGNREEYQRLSFHLYEQLFAPLQQTIHTESLILIPDQVLQYLPFELLLTQYPAENHTPDHRLSYLIRDYEIRYTPSATVMMTRLSESEEPPRNLLALAPFDQSGIQYSNNAVTERYFSNLNPLPLTGYETREIAKLFRQRDSVWNFLFPEQAEVLTGMRATKSRVMNGVLDDYGFIHFATHAFVHETNPALSGIALHQGDSDNGIVYVSDIYNLRLNADLVVLGACETGLGELHRGEGLIGFTRAFFYAGASNLVVSMWKVNDQSTAHLMINFYRYIREGHRYASALRKAKLDLVDHPEYAFPANWAAFILNGR
jgi:CHAT domain-containing protein/Tfp pilus assembly protein PilF